MLATDLADVLRAAGVKVVETAGWKSRSHRPLIAVKGIICHHTAGPRKTTGTPSLHVVIKGRPAFTANGRQFPAVSGPLCNIYLAPDGTAHIVAAGRANHAGAGEFNGITDGGSHFLGVEAENAGDGTDPWEPAQIEAYEKICAATAVHYGFPVNMVIGHKEWALPRGRKIDPSFDMAAFRARVAVRMDDSMPPPISIDPTKELIIETQMLLNRARAAGVIQTEQLTLDGLIGLKTSAALTAFRAALLGI